MGDCRETSSGRGLVADVSSHDEVIRVMGPPAQEWTDAAGSLYGSWDEVKAPQVSYGRYA